MAAAQETMAAASTCLHAGEAAGEELFRLAARLNTKRVQYQPGGLYTNPYQKDERSFSAIKESFSGSCDTHVRLLKKRHLEDASHDEQEEATKPKAKARRVLPESPRLTWHLCHVKWQRFGLATARASAGQTR